MSIMPASLLSSLVTRLRRAQSCMLAMSGFVFVVLALAACSLGGGGAPPTNKPLSQLHWCGGKPLMLFRDAQVSRPSPGGASTPVASVTQATSTPTTLTNWNQIKNQLGFAVYLPASLPVGTCLMSASGTLHDPVMGGRFSIGFVLPDHDSISLSEAPTQSQDQAFQCSPVGNVISSTPTSGNAAQPPVQLCAGVHDKTNIVFSARGATNALQSFFRNLQPNVNWIPTK